MKEYSATHTWTHGTLARDSRWAAWRKDKARACAAQAQTASAMWDLIGNLNAAFKLERSIPAAAMRDLIGHLNRTALV